MLLLHLIKFGKKIELNHNCYLEEKRKIISFKNISELLGHLK